MTTVQSPAPTGSTTTRPDPGIRITLAVVRVVVAFMWIENTGWKTPPKFNALHAYVVDAYTHPVFPPFAWLAEHVIDANFTAFAWFTLIVEASLGAFLLVGLATRFVALVGIVQVLAITFSALNAPGEWEWSYYLMIVAHLAIFATAAGRYYGVDELLRPRWKAAAGRSQSLPRAGEVLVNGFDKGAIALGVLGVVSPVFHLLDNSSKTNFVAVDGLGLWTFVVLGLVAIVGGVTHRAIVVSAAGAAFAVTAVIQLVQFGRSTNYFDGNGSTFSLMFALALGLLVLGLNRAKGLEAQEAQEAGGTSE